MAFFEREGDVVRVKLAPRHDIAAEILLPDVLPVKARAVAQLLEAAACIIDQAGA